MALTWILYLASVTGALVFHMYYTRWFSWFLLVFLIVLPFFSLLLSLPALCTAKLHLEGPSTALRGENAAARLRLTAVLPAGRCYVRLFEPGKRGKKTFLTRGGNYLLPISTEHCTCREVHLRKARILDYLGLFSFPLRVPDPVTTVVLPVPAPPDPLPDVTVLLSPPLRPKVGGGFSEIHELRDYRPGDAMRDVHWKLSAKSESLIVREAQEEIRTDAILTLKLDGPGGSADSCLDQLCFLSPWLLEKGIPHTVLCVCGPEDSMTAQISGQADLDAFLSRLVRRLPDLRPWDGAVTLNTSAGGWFYSISPSGKEEDQ